MAEIPVFFHRFQVGTVSAAGTDVAFAYDPRWLGTAAAFPISVTMPLRAAPYDTAHIAPWLANLLPEEHQLDMLSRTLGVSAAAARQALSRLAAKREIASPARGFYVVVPPEYRRLGCLPADQFIPSLMEHRKIPYYVALLSAAQYHGAAHHRPWCNRPPRGDSRRRRARRQEEGDRGRRGCNRRSGPPRSADRHRLHCGGRNGREPHHRLTRGK